MTILLEDCKGIVAPAATLTVLDMYLLQPVTSSQWNNVQYLTWYWKTVTYHSRRLVLFSFSTTSLQPFCERNCFYLLLCERVSFSIYNLMVISSNWKECEKWVVTAWQNISSAPPYLRGKFFIPLPPWIESADLGEHLLSSRISLGKPYPLQMQIQ